MRTKQFEVLANEAPTKVCGTETGENVIKLKHYLYLSSDVLSDNKSRGLSEWSMEYP
jgi:hypothetical protein